MNFNNAIQSGGDRGRARPRAHTLRRRPPGRRGVPEVARRVLRLQLLRTRAPVARLPHGLAGERPEAELGTHNGTARGRAN